MGNGFYHIYYLSCIQQVFISNISNSKWGNTMNSQTRVSEFMSRKSSVQKIVKNGFTMIFAYPQNDAREVAMIMKDIKINRMPVLSSPWDKKLVGFIDFNKISALIVD